MASAAVGDRALATAAAAASVAVGEVAAAAACIRGFAWLVAASMLAMLAGEERWKARIAGSWTGAW